MTIRRSGQRPARVGWRALEWIFLLVGLVAVDCFVWMNTSSVLYQAYEDWAFDQTLRGLTPSIGGFMTDEWQWLVSGRREKTETAEAPKPLPIPNGPTILTPPAPRSVIGRLDIPRLNLAVMVREGADERTLSRAVGHIPGTALPGGIGQRWTGRASRYVLPRAAEYPGRRHYRPRDHGRDLPLYREIDQHCHAARCERAESVRRRNADACDLLSVLLRGFGAQAIHRACGAPGGRSSRKLPRRRLARGPTSSQALELSGQRGAFQPEHFRGQLLVAASFAQRLFQNV